MKFFRRRSFGQSPAEVLSSLERMSKENIFFHLRTLHPRLFEQVVLRSFSLRGCPVRCNRTGGADGGVDGRVAIAGAWMLLQVKRYTGYVHSEDVSRLKAMAEGCGLLGIFVHSGKTPAICWRLSLGVVQIVSGERLLQLLLGRSLPIHGVRLPGWMPEQPWSGRGSPPHGNGQPGQEHAAGEGPP